ncbi:MAG: hypothetical protein M1396_04975, partial [Chloroflexi bacterium]|nr:hypothetical protein [Chloroflexota bacterium]
MTAPSPMRSSVLTHLIHWLETLHLPGGYGGPVAHWWGQCLRFTGPAMDWRLEGIILGYLTLWERTGEPEWLRRACVAADEAITAQLPGGSFRHSSFELNPLPVGTPHEAACDAALLRLALALRNLPGQSDTAEYYAQAARKNLTGVYLTYLWDPHVEAFRDVPYAASFVPNKLATTAEAFFALSDWGDADLDADNYARSTLDLVLRSQYVTGPLTGGLDQMLTVTSRGWKLSGRCFPMYTARCLPALLAAAERTSNDRYALSARAAAHFIARHVSPEGSLPLVIYANGSAPAYPRWIAALGDICRAFDLFSDPVIQQARSRLEQRLLAGQDANGAFRTAEGFATLFNGAWNPRLPELRDLLHVAGWNDKAFRFLAAHSPLDSTSSSISQ